MGSSWLALCHCEAHTSDENEAASSTFASNVQLDIANSLKESFIFRLTKTNTATQQVFCFLEGDRLYKWLIFSNTFLLREDTLLVPSFIQPSSSS